MPSGTVKRWHSEKGFGFIEPSDGGNDYFCHVSGLVDGDGSIQEGDSVTFKVEYDERKGKDRAVQVRASGGGGGGGRGRSRSRSRGRGGGGGGRGDYDRDSGRGGGRDRSRDRGDRGRDYDRRR
eukprot:gnl/TRDRNA2_/TRDRNA2_184147_c0_seq1.p2 gnl/TRDRNA2_/TRDRNA2_184147_c0~~gnl/TRDRNA2_/TRDRNA2_184147_c0_seq1.p2  ORF type:complete len:145 (+),score=18.48 gnl/TRDRNA2_/TRDRNA2_184147_c0_seq1:66-437(+)